MSSYNLIGLIGKDAHDFAQRIFSVNLKTVSPNQGGMSCILGADGKLKSLFWALKTDQGLELLCAAEETKALINEIQKYHFAEDFELTSPLSISLKLSKAPPDQPRALCSQLTKQNNHYRGFWRDLQYDFAKELSDASSPEQLELLRVEACIPRRGFEFDDSGRLIFELGLQEICEDDKGCYVGQEVVERVRSRGGDSAKKLCLLEFKSEVAPEEELFDDSKTVGQLTKTVIRKNDQFKALAYLQRSSLQIERSFRTKKSEQIGRLIAISGQRQN